ncbi:universal stress protein [Mucilaginibacter aquariorum]|uniref:Universal stress protein n=1 Tax=Mucilaginibacter aquariorum TaxID=2967225 RepID=A0ABT1TA33_9SPHI|nr:universal stress protein [Mucilaginibacter aquariorum]MCQ6961503.1 universal stress protein [Mucilaginibacter aquariorum]
MKQILVMIDFSVNAAHAADYAFRLAACLQMDILLVHYTGQKPPVDSGISEDWLEEQRLAQQKAGVEKLRLLSVAVRKLAESLDAGAYLPAVRYQWQDGAFDPRLAVYDPKSTVGLLVAGSHEYLPGGKPSQDHARLLIEHGLRPLLIVPPDADFQPYRQIVFETSLAEEEMARLQTLIKLAEPFQAELVITPVPLAKKLRDRAERFMAAIARQSPYTHIRFQETLPVLKKPELAVPGGNFDKGQWPPAALGQRVPLLVL